MRFYVVITSIDPKRAALFLGGMLFFASAAASDGESIIEEKNACLAKFAEIGMTERDVSNVSDKEVIAVCGELPKGRINSVWHRELPGGNTEQFAACQDAFEAAGYHKDDVWEVSEAQVIDICETVPTYIGHRF